MPRPSSSIYNGQIRECLLAILHVTLNALEEELGWLIHLARTGRQRRWNAHGDERKGRLAPPLPVHRQNLVGRVLLGRFQSREGGEGVALLIATKKDVAQFDTTIDQTTNVLR